MDYLPIIGLEVHVELGTNSKMFCSCSAHHFLEKPNIHTCPVCLGLPGALPVPNKKAIDWCMLIGLSLNCEIQDEAKFDRKNYFYPDLPKGYQISQYDEPFCKNGYLEIKTGSQGSKKIRINRVHMEEDTAKLLHTTVNGEKVSLIDFNRSGVPLVEIVTEPDINSAEEAVIYLKKLQQIIRYLDVSDCDMEKGSMRLEVNISLLNRHSEAKPKNPRGSFANAQDDMVVPKYKVEVKNINSFRFVGKAINYEIERQKEILESGRMPIQETRGFSEGKGKTFSQRSKEEAHDYRYFPEPDIPPFINLKAKSSKLKALLPELPDQKLERFIKAYKISQYNGEILVADKKTADYFEETSKVALSHKIEPTRIANIIINKKVDIGKYLPAELVKMMLKSTQQLQVDEQDLIKNIKQVLAQNPKAVADYKKGKEAVIGFLVGQVMKELKGKGNPQVIQKLIKKLL